jgi:ElaA protein
VQAIEWQWCRFDELTPRQLYAIFAARESVFVVEQACAYQDIDGLDFQAHHLIAWSGTASEKSVAAYLRVFAPGAKFREPAIGRVLTTQAFRGTGLGRKLMQTALEHIEHLYPGQGVRISAQTYLDVFYRSFGFEPCSAGYLEDGIAHVEMLKT